MGGLHYFAEVGLVELGTMLGVVFGAFAAMLVGFYQFAQKQMKESRTERSDERRDFTRALHELAAAEHSKSEAWIELAASNREIAKETRRGSLEAKQRNGHLAEMMMELADRNLQALQNIQVQNVTQQVVKREVVENKEEPKK